MRLLNRLLTLAAVVVLGALPASAQEPAGTPVDPDATLVDELVVVARYGGPAMWRVMDADTTVWVLGVPSLAPKHMQWEQDHFLKRLEGANAVILPARGLRVRLAGAPVAAFNYFRLKSGTPFEERLAPAERARFAAARERVGEEPRHYGTNHPLAAALILTNDYREKNQLTDQDPAKLIRLLAQQHHVPVEARTYDLGPLLGSVAKVSRQAGDVCLQEVLAEVEAGPGGVLAAAKAWANGDVPGALAQERTYERCLSVAPGAAAFDARTKADEAQLIADALKKPGHAIAVVQLRPLLSQGGILDRLRAQGFTVKTPGEE
ncbi:MAG TPA: TraB/GumN family protein [Phenylobacterium sp.]|nr:TraB/GumN family protein [Phenylobacterium sp.]